jgi:hypothetical protein
MSQVNVRQLFEDKQARLELSHIAGKDGTDRIIDNNEVITSNIGVVATSTWSTRTGCRY